MQLQSPTPLKPILLVEDDASPEGFRADLPALPPGEYSLSAAIDLIPEDGGATQLISGPAVPVILR